MELLSKISKDFQFRAKWIGSISQWQQILRDATRCTIVDYVLIRKVSSDWMKGKVIFCIVRTPYKLSQLSIWEETLRKKIRIFTFNQSYNRETVRFGFIFIWSVSTLNGFTSHLLLYLWLNYKYPTKQVPVPRLLQFPRYYTAAGACWINLFRVVIPLKQIQTRNQFHVPYSTEQIHDNARKLCYHGVASF